MTETKLERALKHYKVDSGETFEEIAARVGVSRQTLMSKVSGLTPINFRQAKILADTLGMTLDELYSIAPIPEEAE